MLHLNYQENETKSVIAIVICTSLYERRLRGYFYEAFTVFYRDL